MSSQVLRRRTSEAVRGKNFMVKESELDTATRHKGLAILKVNYKAAILCFLNILGKN